MLLVVGSALAIAVVAAAALTTISLFADRRGPATSTSSRAQHSSAGSTTSSGVSEEDELAARPMAIAAPELAQPTRLGTRQIGTLRLPAPLRRDPSGVATGFPHTPAGALAQLVAIDQGALQSVSVPATQDLIERWAAPGGPTPGTWSTVAGVAALLSAAGAPADGTGQLIVTTSPSMGLIKGTVGPDFVVACVDLTVTATLGPATTAGSTHRTAVADCQRMFWDRSRWVIGPGAEPAPAPSLWPGTDASAAVGYVWLEVTP